jgi:hypothetical protein
MDGIPSSSSLPPSVPTPTGGVAAGGGHGGPPGRTITLSAVTVAVAFAVAFLGLGYAGMAPWSGGLPGFHHAAGGSTPAVSFATARSAADPLAAAYGGGGWTLVAAAGFEPAAAFTFPGPDANVYGGVGLGAPPVYFCNWSAIGGSNLTGISVGASAGPLGGGYATAWLLGYTSSAGAELTATVLGGQAALYAVMTGPQCTMGMTMNPVPAQALDSPAAASIARAWGGSAFQANATTAIAVYTLTGGYTFTIPPPMYGNGSGPLYPNGTPSPGPMPPPINTSTYTYPATWSVGYSSCSFSVGPVPMPYSSGGSSGGSFAASLNAVNGTVLSVYASLGPTGGCYGAYTGSPPTLPPGPVAVMMAGASVFPARA